MGTTTAPTSLLCGEDKERSRVKATATITEWQALSLHPLLADAIHQILNCLSVNGQVVIFYIHSLFRRFVLTKLRVIPKGALSEFGDLEKMYVPDNEVCECLRVRAVASNHIEHDALCLVRSHTTFCTSSHFASSTYAWFLNSNVESFRVWPLK